MNDKLKTKSPESSQGFLFEKIMFQFIEMFLWNITCEFDII